MTTNQKQMMTTMECGKMYLVEMPYSEVCMHMQIAGQMMQIELVGNPKHLMVQVFDLSGALFSFPITQGEAGVYTHTNEETHEEFLYCYAYLPPEEKPTGYCACGAPWQQGECPQCHRGVREKLLGSVLRFNEVDDFAAYLHDVLDPRD